MTNSIIYADNSSTSFPKPDSVYEAMTGFYKNYGGNPGRSSHKLSATAYSKIGSVRSLVAALFNSKSENVVFTLNATDALNIAIRGVLKQGDHVITSVLEHNSVNRPLNHLERAGLINITRVEPSDETITFAQIAQHITPRTKLVAITHCSNVTGWVMPVEEIGYNLKAYYPNIVFLADCAQTAGAFDIDVEAMNMDILVFTAHKGLMGAMGVGGLVVSPDIEIEPLRVGGSGDDSRNPFHPENMPDRLEAGTPNIPGIVALGAGIEFIMDTGIDAIRDKEETLIVRLREKLAGRRNLRIFTSEKHGGASILSFNIDGISPNDVASILDGEFGIATRPGLHCAPYCHRFLGTYPDGAVRISLGFFNTMDEVDFIAESVNKIAESVK